MGEPGSGLLRRRLQRAAAALTILAAGVCGGPAGRQAWAWSPRQPEPQSQTISVGQAQALPQTAFRARAADAIFEHLSESNGLANPVVTCFAEDGDGFLWVGSQSGLQRWDGYRFWSYKQVLGSQDSLPDNLVQALYKDWQGRLWIGTSSGGMAMYDRRNDRFVRYRLSPNDLNRVNVFAITGDGGRGLWVGSDTGLDHLDTDSGKFTHVDLTSDNGRRPQHASALARGADGTLWVGTEQGLERSIVLSASNPQTSTFQAVALPVQKGASSEVLALFGDRSGRIWAGTAHGAYVVDSAINPVAGASSGPATGAVRQGADAGTERVARPVAGTGPGSEMLATQRYLSIAQAADGEIWLGTQDEGVLAVTPEEAVPGSGSGGVWAVRRISHDPGVPTSLSDDMVQALYLGRPGIMWAATRRGVSYMATNEQSIITVLGGAGRNNVIRDTNVYTVLARRDGSVWLGLSHHGIDILDANGQRAAEIQAGGKDGRSVLPDGNMNGLIEAGDGSVLIATQRGLYRATPAVGRRGAEWGTPRVAQVPVGQEAGKDLTRVLPDDGRLWLGGLDGLWVFDPKATAPAQRPEMERPLTDQRVTVLMRGEGSSLWIGN